MTTSLIAEKADMRSDESSMSWSHMLEGEETAVEQTPGPTGLMGHTVIFGVPDDIDLDERSYNRIHVRMTTKDSSLTFLHSGRLSMRSHSLSIYDCYARGWRS